MKISRSLRQKSGAMTMPASPLRELVADGRIWIDLGLVFKPGASLSGGAPAKHWRRTDGGDILVEVQTASGSDVTARLSVGAGSLGQGLWRVPSVGCEVVVALPAGDPTFMPTIVAIYSNGQAPERVSDERTILVATDVVEITAPKVILGPDPGNIDETQEGLVHGQGIDSFTGSPYYALGNTTAKVFAKK